MVLKVAENLIWNRKQKKKKSKYCKGNRVTQDQIGIITPYKLQSIYLNKLFRTKSLSQIEIFTVDSFQGREKDYIIISTVRSNSKG